MLTILVPFYNGHHHLGTLLESIPESIPIVIVDDLSDKPLTQVPGARVIRCTEKGYFTGAVNEGLKHIPDGDVLIVNQDTYFTGTAWLDLITQNSPEYDLIGEGVARHPAWPRGYIHGTFMYISRKALDTLGGMDQVWYPLWGSTCEYQLRAARRGLKALPIPQGQIPDFVHTRTERHGDSITQTLKREKGIRGKLIRTPPLVSVVINAYNHGRYLEDALYSLIGGPTSLGESEGQTFQGFEIIIVDDGSLDNTPEVCARLASPEKGIHYYRHDTNRGSAVAMNTGIERARGKYIAPMDSDDMMKPERLERMLILQEANQHSVIYDDVAYFGNGVLGIQTKKGWTYTLPLPKKYSFETILKQNKMHKGLMYPKRAWEEVGGYPPIMNRGREDWAFNVGLGIEGWCGIHTGEADYLYRREGHNRTLTNTTPYHKQKFLAQLMSLYPRVYEGERPPMCCGGSRNTGSNRTRKSVNTPLALPGAESGMIALEYTGTNAGDNIWAGPVTRQNYVMGGKTRRQYVDKRDAGERPSRTSDGSGMLALRENNRYLFEIYKPPEPEVKVITQKPKPLKVKRAT